MIRRLLFFTVFIGMMLSACTDNDSFSSGTGYRLSFSEDTISFDTLFSAVPSATQTFWVRNNSGDGIRIRTARLERSNQSGYRVNVDGTYLSPVGTDFEVRKGDSILVFVEVTTIENHSPTPQLVEDNLIFTLESGVEQRVNLRTYSWDAQKITNLEVRRDTTIESTVPLVFYGSGIHVANGATLHLKNTDFYFHDGAGVKVDGRLVAEGCLFRGDRLDRMFSYLPYDRVSGQWEGFVLSKESGDNMLVDCEIRNAVDAMVCDTTTLTMTNVIIHNSSGAGLLAKGCRLKLSYCQMSNSYGDCLAMEGCQAEIDHCTLAQFYPFSGNRGAALRFTTSEVTADGWPLMYDLAVSNTLVTGYEEDVVEGNIAPDDAYSYHFANCLLRTLKNEDETHFEKIIWETPKDTIQGKQHFRLVDEDNLRYDFAIDSISPAFINDIGRY